MNVQVDGQLKRHSQVADKANTPATTRNWNKPTGREGKKKKAKTIAQQR